MTRGSVVVVVIPGALGKPRPALVVQSDQVFASFPSVTILPITSHILSTPLYRITVDPSAENGLRKISQVQVDKCTTIARAKLGPVVGEMDDDTMVRVNHALRVWLGLAG